MIRRVVSYFAPPGRKTGPGFLNLHYWSIYFIKTKLYMHTKIWWSYVHIRYLVHVQKWTYLALGWPYGWALNFNYQLHACKISHGPRSMTVTNCYVSRMIKSVGQRFGPRAEDNMSNNIKDCQKCIIILNNSYDVHAVKTVRYLRLEIQSLVRWIATSTATISSTYNRL